MENEAEDSSRTLSASILGSESLEILKSLSSGRIPNTFPFKYAAPTDAGSPYSLCIAFYPDAVPLRNVDFESTQEVRLPESLTTFIKDECAKWGWAEVLETTDESAKSLFVKAWLRKTDERFRRLDTVSDLLDVDSAWLDGIVRVLQLWRKLEKTSEPSLPQFEQQSPESVFEAFAAFSPPGWTLRQKLEFLTLPYLRYKNRVELLQTWISGAEHLDDVVDAVFARDLAQSLLQVCLSTSSQDWRQVQHVVSNIKPVAEAPSEAISWNSLLKPTSSTLKFFGQLVETAQTARFPDLTFQQLAEWTLGDSGKQLDLLMRFLRNHKHVSIQELDALRSTLFSKISDEVFAKEVIHEALEAQRFKLLRSYVGTPHAVILKAEVQQMVDRFGTPEGSNLSLKQILMTLELANPGSETTAKFERLQQLQSTFNIDPVFALNHSPIELVRYAIEHGSQAYLRVTQLQNIVAGKENGLRVAELCVEAALVDDNFSAACELIDRDFIQDSSPGAWLALYEVGKFMSPRWSFPRPSYVLQKQQKYLSRSLTLCPEGDLEGVLRAWSASEAESEEEQLRGSEPPTHTAARMASPSSDVSDDSEQPKHPGNARDQLSSLLVSGIGWAIGANQ